MSSQQGRRPEADSGGIPGPGLGHVGPVCPICGSHNREQSQFCSDCGAALLNYCPQCGRQIALEDLLCDDCSRAQPGSSLVAGRCQRCGRQNDGDAEVCVQCGARLRAECPHCGAALLASFSFCPRCGFHYSRFVTDRLVRGLRENAKQSRRSAPKLDFGLVLMIALSFVSVLIMIYILNQI